MSELIDNRARRIATLIQHHHKGEALEAVKGQVREIVRQTDVSEIITKEQELISGACL